MATPTNSQEGSGLFYYITPEEGDNLNEAPQRKLKNQSELYFEKVANLVPHQDKYGKDNGQGYTDSMQDISEFGVQNRTTQPNEFGKQTYIEALRSQGSQILRVAGEQIGNMDTAQIDDFKNYDEYFNHARP